VAPRLLSDRHDRPEAAADRRVSAIVACQVMSVATKFGSGILRRVLPSWRAGDSTIKALVPYRQGLPCHMFAFLSDHLATEFRKPYGI